MVDASDVRRMDETAAVFADIVASDKVQVLIHLLAWCRRLWLHEFETVFADNVASDKVQVLIHPRVCFHEHWGNEEVTLCTLYI